MKKNEFEDKNEKNIANREIGFCEKSIIQPFGLTIPMRQRGS